MKTKQILVVNPGSTSTKVALYENDAVLWEEEIRYTKDEINRYVHIADQQFMRQEDLRRILEEKKTAVADLWAICSRGPDVYPISSGTYAVDENMMTELMHNPCIEHACNLGAMMTYPLGQKYGIPVFIVDTGLVDELTDEAGMTGIKGVRRRCRWHALNQRAIYRRLAESLGKDIAHTTCVICHMGGGLSVGAHCNGRTVDVNNSMDGDGPMSANRAGSIPNIDILEMAFDQHLSKREIWDKLVGSGGLVGHLGTENLQEIEARIAQGDTYAAKVIDCMVYQIAKEIGALCTALKGQVDAIALTGGMAHSDYLVSRIKKYVAYLAPVQVYPGECEMEALYEGAKRVMDGVEEAKHFVPSGKIYHLID